MVVFAATRWRAGWSHVSSVDEFLETLPAFLDEVTLENALGNKRTFESKAAVGRHANIRPSYDDSPKQRTFWVYLILIDERDLLDECLPREVGNDDLHGALDLVPQPLEVAVTTTHAGLLHAKHRQIRLEKEERI